MDAMYLGLSIALIIMGFISGLQAGALRKERMRIKRLMVIEAAQIVHVRIMEYALSNDEYPPRISSLEEGASISYVNPYAGNKSSCEPMDAYDEFGDRPGIIYYRRLPIDAMVLGSQEPCKSAFTIWACDETGSYIVNTRGHVVVPVQ